MRRPAVTSWWLVLLCWAVFLAMAAAALSSYLSNGAGFSLASVLVYLFLPSGVTVVTFLSRAQNPKERVFWVSTPTLYLATTLPMFLFVALVLVAVASTVWQHDAHFLLPMSMLFITALSFLGSLTLRVLEFAHVRG